MLQYPDHGDQTDPCTDTSYLGAHHNQRAVSLLRLQLVKASYDWKATPCLFRVNFLSGVILFRKYDWGNCSVSEDGAVLGGSLGSFYSLATDIEVHPRHVYNYR